MLTRDLFAVADLVVIRRLRHSPSIKVYFSYLILRTVRRAARRDCVQPAVTGIELYCLERDTQQISDCQNPPPLPPQQQATQSTRQSTDVCVNSTLTSFCYVIMPYTAGAKSFIYNTTKQKKTTKTTWNVGV